jgi:hypothetical protein
MGDSFNGDSGLFIGYTTNRNRCSNVFAAEMKNYSGRQAVARHTASLENKVKLLCEAIRDAVEHGVEVREAYGQAADRQLTRDQAQVIFDRLFPTVETNGESTSGTLAAATRAENRRQDALAAMAMPCNNEGQTLATLWNAATYLVDRNADGTNRESRGSMVDAMLFGSRGKRVETVRQMMVEVLQTDGTTVAMTAFEAVGAGVDERQVGSSILESMLSDASN